MCTCLYNYLKTQGLGKKTCTEDGEVRISDLYNYFLQISVFSEVSRPAVGPTKTPVQWVAGGGDLSPRIRRPGREGDHASPSSVKFKNNWTYTFTLTYGFIQDFGRETS